MCINEFLLDHSCPHLFYLIWGWFPLKKQSCTVKGKTMAHKVWTFTVWPFNKSMPTSVTGREDPYTFLKTRLWDRRKLDVVLTAQKVLVRTMGSWDKSSHIKCRRTVRPCKLPWLQQPHNYELFIFWIYKNNIGVWVDSSERYQWWDYGI